MVRVTTKVTIRVRIRHTLFSPFGPVVCSTAPGGIDEVTWDRVKVKVRVGVELG